MPAIMKREFKNYVKNPLFWMGLAITIIFIFQEVSPYLSIHYLKPDEQSVGDYPEIVQGGAEGEVYEGYIPATKEQQRELWEREVTNVLTSVFSMSEEKAKHVITEMKEMDVSEACRYLEEEYRYHGAINAYKDAGYYKGTADEINAYIANKLEQHSFSYYFARKFADFAGAFMGFFATILLSMLFMQDTRKNTYELLHTKPIRTTSYIFGKAGGGFLICLFILGILNLVFWLLCAICTKNSGFEVRLVDFLAATCLYIVPSMLMIVAVYCLIALIFKNPLPAVPLLVLYMVYSNMGSRSAEGIYGYYGRPLAIMVRFPGLFFDTTPPPFVLLNQSFLILASFVILFVSMQLWKRRRL